MDADKLKEILEKHAKWLRNEDGGKWANLYGANLTWADLTGADLNRADLNRADLNRADLTGANLNRADLTGANLTGAKGIISIGPIGSRSAIMYAVKHETCVMVKAGCFWGDLYEFEVAVHEKHAGTKHERDYMAAIALIESYFAEE
jgi:hypothetical protein